MERIRQKANQADDLQLQGDSNSEIGSPDENTRIMRNKSRALNLDSRQDSVNDGGLGLADVLGNADAILGIGMDGIGNGLRS